jgi:aspartyl/glutamyl-tRNA(Asn/Gln) amidotransferase C subunit
MTDVSVDISALAGLARLELDAAELARLEKEIPEILGFVETIQKADLSGAGESRGLQNVMREDTRAHEPGVYTEVLLSAAPAREGDRVAVKQVVSRKQK